MLGSMLCALLLPIHAYTEGVAFLSIRASMKAEGTYLGILEQHPPLT